MIHEEEIIKTSDLCSVVTSMLSKFVGRSYNLFLSALLRCRYMYTSLFLRTPIINVVFIMIIIVKN